MNSCVQQTGRSGRHEGLRSASSRQVACPASVIPSASGSRLERREETACRQAGIRRGAGLLFFTVHGMGASRSTHRGNGTCRLPNGRQALSPLGWATGPCRPLGGRQAFFFFFLFFYQGPRCEFKEKKLHLKPVALWGGDRGVFLKYCKTDIYF